MKEFRKNEQGYFVCEECKNLFETLHGLSKHIKVNHISIHLYFDKWIKETKDGKCEICGNKTELHEKLSRGYNYFCSKKCKIRYVYNGKNKMYFPDFYISSLNLIIEIKSTYFLNKNIEIDSLKEKAVIREGFKYLRILDKNYNEFIKLI